MSLFEEGYQRLRTSEKLGVGRFCEVRRYHYYGLGGFERSYAVKKLLPHEVQSEDSIKSLETEAHLLARLHHPLIIGAVDWVREKDEYFLILDYCPGMDLKRLLDHHQNIPIEVVLSLGYFLGLALQGIHTAQDGTGSPLQIIHRDFSLGNILVLPNGLIRVVDFGSATSPNFPQKAVPRLFRGREIYMPPESLSGEGIDQRMDLYDLGIMLYHLVTGAMPYSGASAEAILTAIAHESVAKPSKQIAALSRHEDQLIMRLIHKEPAKRFAHAAEFLEALAKCLKKRSLFEPQRIIGSFFWAQ